MQPDLSRALQLLGQEQLIHGAGVAFRYFDLLACALWAITGARLAAKRGFDLSGIFAIALVSATGGGLLRDGLFLQAGPPTLVRSPAYIAIAAAAALIVWALGARIRRHDFLERPAQWADALGLGGFAVVGMQLATVAGVSVPGVVLIGVVNAVGGSVLRNLLMLQIPEVFRPGELTALAALGGSLLYVLLTVVLTLNPQHAALPAVCVVVGLRIASQRFRLHTRAAAGFETDREP